MIRVKDRFGGLLFILTLVAGLLNAASAWAQPAKPMHAVAMHGEPKYTLGFHYFDLQVRHRLAYLFISHDLRVVRALASHLIVIREGKVVEAGEAEGIFNAPQDAYTRALISAALNMEVAGNAAITA